MRDSLSLLDQCAAFYMNETLTYDHVLEVLGAVDTEVFKAAFKTAACDGCTSGDQETVDELVMQEENCPSLRQISHGICEISFW